MSPPNLTITPQTDETRAAEQLRQDEITAREGIEDNLNDDALGRRDGDQPRSNEEPEPAPRVQQKSPGDIAREEIAARFNRGGPVIPFDGDMTKDENLYGEVAQETLDPDPDLPDPGVPQDRTPAPAEKKYTIKVRGQDVHLTEAELLERASKVEAGDSYLQEARDLLKQAKDVKAGRAAPDSQHPEDRDAADDGQDNTTREPPRRPGEALKSVVEKIQFGDPEEAAQDLGRYIAEEAGRQATEGHLQRLVANDLTRAQKSLKDFTDANPEIAQNEDAAMLMENRMYKIFREEIKAQGVDEAQMPKTPKELAEWHRLYRVHGAAVSSIPDVLQKAKAHVVSVLGTSTSPQPAVRPKGSPNVHVNVDRTERRAAIPNQPTRAVAPRRDPVAPQGKTPASKVIEEMRKARGQPIG